MISGFPDAIKCGDYILYHSEKGRYSNMYLTSPDLESYVIFD